MKAADLEQVVEELGFEVVTADRGGGRSRPILRLRIDRPADGPEGSTISVDDCATVTRALREWLEEQGEDHGDWVLEVSSPGVDRPLVKASDFARFAGSRARVKGYGPLAGGAKQLEGVLLGLVEGDPESFALEIDGERIEIPLDGVASARLVYDWDGASNGGAR